MQEMEEPAQRRAFLPRSRSMGGPPSLWSIPKTAQHPLPLLPMPTMELQSASQCITVGSHAKFVNSAEGLFSQDITNATYIAYTSDRNMVGLQLNGTADGTMLDGLPGLAGGGGSSSGTTTTNIKNNVSIFDSGNSKDIVSTQNMDNGTVSITLVANSDSGRNLAAGSIISILPGADDRYPLACLPRLTVSTNADGTKQVVLQPATLAEVTSSSIYKSDPVALNADNFVGVIAPQATSGPSESKVVMMLLQQSSKIALDGGIIVTNGPSSARMAPDSAVSKTLQGTEEGGNVSINLEGGDVSIDLKLKLLDMGIDASRMKPYGTSLDAGFEISGSLKNLMITDDHDFSTSSGLKSLDMRVTGDVQLEGKFIGSGSATLGYYSRAWDEVEDAALNLLGISG